MSFTTYRDPIILEKEEEYNESIGLGLFKKLEEVPKEYIYPYKYWTIFLKSSKMLFEEQFLLIQNRIKSKSKIIEIKNIYDFINIKDLNNIIKKFIGNNKITNCKDCKEKIILDKNTCNEYYFMGHDDNYICNDCKNKKDYKICQFCANIVSVNDCYKCDNCEDIFANKCYNSYRNRYHGINMNLCECCDNDISDNEPTDL